MHADLILKGEYRRAFKALCRADLEHIAICDTPVEYSRHTAPLFVIGAVLIIDPPEHLVAARAFVLGESTEHFGLRAAKLAHHVLGAMGVDQDKFTRDESARLVMWRATADERFKPHRAYKQLVRDAKAGLKSALLMCEGDRWASLVVAGARYKLTRAEREQIFGFLCMCAQVPDRLVAVAACTLRLYVGRNINSRGYMRELCARYHPLGAKKVLCEMLALHADNISVL